MLWILEYTNPHKFSLYANRSILDATLLLVCRKDCLKSIKQSSTVLTSIKFATRYETKQCIFSKNSFFFNLTVNKD